MKSKILLILGILAIVLVAGCTSETGQKVSTNLETKPRITTLEPSQLALQLSDLPSNYSIKERAERVKSDIIQEAINIGWQKGYYVKFVRLENLLDYTTIEHGISIYPIENISKVLAIPRYPEEGFVVEKMSKPNIGDDSNAFRITTKDEYGTEYRYYMIEFIKMNVYEYLLMMGITTDYELLKELARKAEAKAAYNVEYGNKRNLSSKGQKRFAFRNIPLPISG